MHLQDTWTGFSTDQYKYITNIIENSDAKSVCELGTFVGTTAKHIWESIKDSGKKLYLVDNYMFLPEDRRQKFFSAVKHSIDPTTKDIIPVLESSHTYDWTQHDFVFFGHHDADHMLPDLEKLMNSDVQYAIIGDGMPGCFRRTKAVFEFLSARSNYGFEAQYYLNGLIVIGRKKLECILPTTPDSLFGHSIKYIPKTKSNYEKAIDELRRIY
jgi:hypothetical protein